MRILQKRNGLLLLTLLLCLLLAACGKHGGDEGPETPEETVPPVVFAAGSVEADASELTITLAPGETELLSRLPNLRFADFSGSPNEEEIAAWAKFHPEIDVRFTVTLPDGTVLPSDTTSYDMSGMSIEECERFSAWLMLLPELKSVNLGREGNQFTWDDIACLRTLMPKTEFKYAFKLYGTDCDLSNTRISLYYIPVDDDAAELEYIMPLMPQLNYIDMDGCGLPPWRCEEIMLTHPGVKVVFRVWFGENYSVRTDVERILASSPTRGGLVSPENYDGLFYCHDVKYLDLGHNTSMTDISFVREMPKLEVAILSMCNWSDASPLADCHELEYLEMFNTLCTDLRPLSGLTKLRHLNIASIGVDQPYEEQVSLTDISLLYSLTGLERLWIGAINPVPAEQVAEMQKRAPQCEINTEVGIDPAGGRWRYVELANYVDTYVDTYHDRYIKLREQFGNYESSVYSLAWNDPLYKEE